MKITGPIILAILARIMPTLHAQDAAPPSVDLYSGQKQSEISPTASPEPMAPDVPELSQLDQAFKQTSLGKEADEHRLHVEWRKMQNQVVNDPTLRAAKATAQAARTDFEKRKRLRYYYNLYYERMSALASSEEMKLALEELKASHVGQTAQPRVRAATDAGLATPSPTPGSEKKQKKHRK